MRNYLTGIVLLAMTTMAGADDGMLKKTAMAQVESMNKALLKGDYATIADLTHPKVVAMNGGRDKMIADMERTMKAIKEQGIEFVSAIPSAPTNPVNAGSEVFLVVPFKYELKTPMGKLTQETFVIGVTADDGKSWKFVNGDLDPKVVRDSLPNLPKDFKLPERQMPKLEK